MSTARCAALIAQLFEPRGRFHGRYDPPEEDGFQEIAPGGLWQAPIFPVRSNSARLLRVYLIGGHQSALLQAHWSSETRALLRLSSGNHPALPRLREAALLEDEGLGYLILDHPGAPLTQGHAALAQLREQPSTALAHFLRVVDGVAALHRLALLHRNISPHTTCARGTEPDSIVLDGFQLSAFVASWLRGDALRRRGQGFLPGEPSFRVCLPPERLAPVFGEPNTTLESYSGDVFSLGMTGIWWFVPGVEEVDSSPVFINGGYDMSAHREVVTAWHRKLQETRLPKSLIQLLTHASSFDSANRPPSASRILEPLQRAYGALLTEFERTESQERVPRLSVLFMRETAERFFSDGRGRTLPASLDPEEYADLLQRDLEHGVFTWSETGFRKWADRTHRDRADEAKMVLVGQSYAYFAAYYNQGFPGENRNVLLIKYPLEIHSARELLRTGVQRPLPSITVRYFEPHVPQRSLPRGNGWEVLASKVRFAAPSGAESLPLAVTARWVLDVLSAEQRTEEFACERVEEETGAILLRGREPTIADWPEENAEDAFARLCLRGALPTMARLFQAAHEDALAKGDEARFLFRAARGDREPATELKFDKVEDPWTVRFRSVEGASAMPTTGFVRLANGMHQALLGRQRAALDVACERFPDLIAQLSAPSSLRIPVQHEYGQRVDLDTRERIERIRARWPISVVRGPPGTGKTFLASHVIRAILEEDPFARILVAAQSHHALDNLLEGASNISRDVGGAIRPLFLRSVSQARKHKVSASAAELLVEKQLEAIRAHAIDIRHRNTTPGPLKGLRKRWRKLLADRMLDLELFQRLPRAASVVFSTCTTSDPASLGGRGDLQMFDWVIVEEAARGWVTEMLIPLVRGIRWMLIGDQAQLPAFRLTDIEKLFDVDTRERVTPTSVEVLEESHRPLLRYFGNLMSVDPPPHRQDPREELRVQHRMHPDIANLVSYAYYDNQLVTAETARRPHQLALPPRLQGSALLWLDTGPLGLPAHERGYGNKCEAQLLRYAIDHHARPYPVHESGIPPLAVLTPYRDQLEQLRGALSLHDTEVHTIDSFQGREAEVVLVSLVRNNTHTAETSALGFLVEAERVNVLFSRARRLLVVAGCLAHFERFPETHWGRVAEFLRQHPKSLVSATDLGFRWDSEARR